MAELYENQDLEEKVLLLGVSTQEEDMEASLDELAEQVHMSKYHFLRKFKELTGVTVHAFVTDKRLIKACRAISEGMNISQAYQAAGFSDYSSFLRNFKNAYGISPGKYKDFYPDS